MNEIISLFRLEHSSKRQQCCARVSSGYLYIRMYLKYVVFVPLPQMNARMSRTPLSRVKRAHKKEGTHAEGRPRPTAELLANNTTVALRNKPKSTSKQPFSIAQTLLVAVAFIYYKYLPQESI
jgi:hypothetical protein